MSKITIEQKKVMTPEFRVSFPNVFEAKSFQGQKAKFNITMLYNKKSDMSLLKNAVKNAIIEKYGSMEKKPKKFRLPFRDGDVEKPDMAGYAGHYFVTASAKEDKQPTVVDRKRQEIIDPRDFYAGCYARATLIAFCYDTVGNVGASFALINLQKLRDGDKFGGGKAAFEEFDDGLVEDSSEDEESYKTDKENEFAEDDILG